LAPFSAHYKFFFLTLGKYEILVRKPEGRRPLGIVIGGKMIIFKWIFGK
jgi:hypothetical protein